MKERKYIEIAERIRQDIEKGIYQEGGRIPPIRELAERYGANPQTVNKATAWLESQGLLELRRGAGSKVLKAAKPVQAETARVIMLIDRHRAQLIADLNDLVNFHAKDIYLSFMMEAKRRALVSGFIAYDPEGEPSAEFLQALHGCSGFLIQGSLPDAWMARISAANIPAVLINRRPPAGQGRFGAILIPDRQIGDLVNYLASLGHQRFLFAISSIFERSSLFDARYETMQKSLRTSGYPGEALEIFEYGDDAHSDATRLAALVSQGFSAVVGFNDVSALGLYPLAARISLKIPEDLSIVGFDDIILAQVAVPPLTTIRVDRKEMVKRAFDALTHLGLSDTSQREIYEVPTTLLLRKSAFRH